MKLVFRETYEPRGLVLCRLQVRRIGVYQLAVYPFVGVHRWITTTKKSFS